jgi:hypothetical protein
MDTSPPPPAPPSYGNPLPPAPKKGLGTGAKVGIGCGAVLLLLIIAAVVASVMFGGKLKDIAQEMEQNPTRGTASMMVKVTGGQMVAEDDVNKRYTVKDPKGKLMTIYWDEVKKAPSTVEGDFSAIPAAPAIPTEPAPAPGN